MDKAALLQAIKEAESKAAKELEDAKAKKQQALVAAQVDSERIKSEGYAAVDRQVAEQLAEARRRIEADKQTKVQAGRVKIRKKRETGEARVAEVAEFLVQEFERSVQSGLR